MNEGYHLQDPAERTARFERAQRDEILTTLFNGALVGFDSLPEDRTAEEMWACLDAA
jgi:hypothetical protein